MGAAKRRGTFEERRAAAIARNAERYRELEERYKQPTRPQPHRVNKSLMLAALLASGMVAAKGKP